MDGTGHPRRRLRARLKQGDRNELLVDRLDAAGDGLALHEGRHVLVPGAYPTERVAVRIEHVSKQTPKVRATLLDLVTPHVSRREPPCERSVIAGGECTGCPLIGLEDSAQVQTRRRMLALEHGLEIDRFVRVEGSELGYRRSSKRVAFSSQGRLRLGSWMRGSHHPVLMRGCRVEHPRIEAAIRLVEEAASAAEIVPFDERKRLGDLRYVWFKTDGERVLITLITAEEESRAAELLPPLLEGHGVAHSVQPGEGNAVRGDRARHLRGPSELMLTLAGVELPMGALGFLQPNPAAAELAYRDLVGTPEGCGREGEWALDLYAGAGITTSLLRGSFERVTPCESYPESAARLGVSPERAEDFLRRVIEEQTEGGKPPELVVANPPRGGLGAEVCRRLAELGPRHLSIMSCSASALSRDLSHLIGVGGAFELVAIRAYDTLPQTAHVELVAWLEARG